MSTPQYKDPLALPAGSLRHAVTILQPSFTTDASGTITTWSTFTVVRASLDPIRGIEIIHSGQDVTNVFLTMKCRYIPGIDTTMRAQSQHGQYIIQAIENVLERNRVLVLTLLAVGQNE